MATIEAVQCYSAALKQGQKEYKNCVHRGLYPYIQSLQHLRQSAPLSQISLGTMEIPIYLIVGAIPSPPGSTPCWERRPSLP